MREELYGLVKSYIEKCNHCGDCRAVCPVFAQEPVETAVARGKLLLAGRVLGGEIEPSPALLERFDKCLLCESCTFQCAFHLRVDRVVMATRAVVAESIGLPAAKKVVFDLLANHQSTLSLACAAGSVTSSLWGKRVPQDSGLNLRFPLAGLADGRVFPRPAARSFRGRVPQFQPAEGPKMTVAFFTGCYINHVAPFVGMDTLSLLRRAGVSVHIPPDQQCCGTPMAASGDLDTALRLMRSNVASLSAVHADAVVVACATCGTALRDLYPQLLAKLDPSLEDAARQLAAKTYDIAEFLTEGISLPEPPALGKKLRLTYHDSCHLCRGLGVRAQPRKLLEGIGNVELVEMEGADVCCGGAGAFSFTQQRLSRAILAKKTRSIVATSADVVVSGCHGCNLQISEGLARAQAPIRTLHTVQLLEMAYRGGKK